MTDYVILNVISNMYHCERCKELIKDKRAVGMRDEKGNHYFHVEECQENNSNLEDPKITLTT